jgi:hypothetical protein
MEAVALQHIRDNYPVGPTAEAVARAYIEIARRKAERGEEERACAERAEHDRAGTIWAVVRGSMNSPVADPDAALSLVRQFVADYADWTDEEIADRIVAGLEHAAGREEKDTPHVEGLTIRSRL